MLGNTVSASAQARKFARSTSARASLYQRRKDKPRLTTDQKRAARRVKELNRIYHDQYPNGLPHNGLGVNYAKYMCRTLAFLPDDRRARWLDRYAAWIDQKTRDYILRLGPYWYADRSLGNKLELHDEDRERLQTWSIEAIDVSHEERQVINRAKNRQAQEHRRRKNGAKPREQYEAESLSRTQPWKAVGVSRSTWERRRRKSADASPSRPSLINSTNGTLASSKPHALTPTPPELSKRPRPTLPGQDNVVVLHPNRRGAA